jgi:hypothetical protein
VALRARRPAGLKVKYGAPLFPLQLYRDGKLSALWARGNRWRKVIWSLRTIAIMRVFYPILAGLFLCLAFVRPALAQRQEPVRVIIAPFTGPSLPKNNELSRVAEDTIRAEFTKGGRYTPVAGSDLLQTANRLGLRRPFTREALAKLAGKSGATEIVSGEVAFLRRENQFGLTVTQVGVRALVRDVNTGDLVNGAVHVGEVLTNGPNSADQYMDTLRRDVALSAAACAAKITSFRIPQGVIPNMVVADPPEDIIVNVGAGQGLMVGSACRKSFSQQDLSRFCTNKDVREYSGYSPYG